MAALALVEGALLLARVSGQLSHLVHAKRAALALLAAPPADRGEHSAGINKARDSSSSPATTAALR
jgi:hypothetical protein